MSEEGSDSKIFDEISRNQTAHGSTSKHNQKFTKCIKHLVSRVDTLQGIALKYGVTVQQINRENRLWTNDSLFLREYLYIPVTSENSHLIQDDWDLVLTADIMSRSGSDFMKSDILGKSLRSSSEPHCNQSFANGNQSQGANRAASNGSEALVDSRSTRSIGSDYFSKYDSKIADLKSKIEQLEKTASISQPRSIESQPDTNLSSLIPRRHSSDIAHATRPLPHYVSYQDPESPVMIIRSNTRSTKVQSALTLSEQAHDDLFEL